MPAISIFSIASSGRETFNRIIEGYAATFRTRGCSTKDFTDLVRSTAKIDLSQLNNDWIFTAAWAERIEHGTSIQDLEAYYRSSAHKAQR